MKEPHRKGVANRSNPESCAGGGNIAGEALTGAHAGQPSSSEITTSACRPCPDRGKATPGAALSEQLTGAAESETLCMRDSSMRENREAPGIPTPVGGAGRSEKAASLKSDMHVLGESDDLIVPTKRANNAGQPAAAESVEGRGSTKRNATRTLLAPDTEPGKRGMGLWGVREAAKRFLVRHSR